MRPKPDRMNPTRFATIAIHRQYTPTAAHVVKMMAFMNHIAICHPNLAISTPNMKISAAEGR
jgi:hypothetical protein